MPVMRPKAPRLLPSEYGRANYLRREVQLAEDYRDLYPDSDGAAALAAFFAAAATSDGSTAVVADGQELAVTGGTVTFTVEDGVLSAEFVAE